MRPPATTPAWSSIIAALLAVVVVVAIPALRASAPLTAPAQWTIADLATGAARALTRRSGPNRPPAALNHWLEEARSLGREFHGASPGAQRRLDMALALAALIPVLAIAAGLCAGLSLILALWRRQRWLAGPAIVGAVSTSYVIAASWWLTRMVHTELTQVAAGVQQRWGGLITALGGHTLTAALTTPLGLEPQAGLYVLLLAFLAMLVLPGKA